MAGKSSWPRLLGNILLAPKIAADPHEALQALPSVYWHACATGKGNVSNLIRIAQNLADDCTVTLQMYEHWLDRMCGGDGYWEQGTTMNY